MSKEVKIPTSMQPDFVCTINNTTYRYKAGTTQTVPDEVAELIENINAQEPKEDPKAGESFEQQVSDVVDPKIAAAVEEVTEKYVIDLTSLEVQPGVQINLTEEDVITYDEFIAATSSGRDIYVKVTDGEDDWYWLMDVKRDDNKRIATTKAMQWSGDGLTLATVLIWGDDADAEKAVYVEMNIGFAANPYAG